MEEEIVISMADLANEFAKPSTFNNYKAATDSVNVAMGWEKGFLWVDRLVDDKAKVVTHLIAKYSPKTVSQKISGITSMLRASGELANPNVIREHYTSLQEPKPKKVQKKEEPTQKQLFREIRTALRLLETEMEELGHNSNLSEILGDETEYTDE